MKRLATILLLSSLSLFGQKVLPLNNYSAGDLFFQLQTPRIGLTNVPEADLPQLLASEAGYSQEMSLQLHHKISSKALTHYRYHIYKHGIRLFGAEAHVGVDKDGKIRLCKLPVLPQFSSEFPFPEADMALQLQAQLGAGEIKKTEQVWFTDGSDYLQRGMVVELYGPETFHQEVLLRGDRIVSQADLLRYFHGHSHAEGPNDSIVSVKVFAPDPLTTAQVNYGAPYSDNGDASVPQLEAERKTKSLALAYENGQFESKNDYVKILDFSAPLIAPVVSTTDQMHYTRDQSGFEDMNVMYHITEHKKHMVSLGFPNIPNYVIEVDPHAIGGADQSFFSTASNPGRLYFGEGGVDDAEDADVIIHEYMHSAIFVASPATTTSTERGCIEEALGDYFAASYSNTVNLHNKSWVFDWDGHNEFWPGREVASTKDYGQQSFKNNNIYAHTDLFASPLMEINEKLGRSTADALVLEAIFSMDANTSMPVMAGYIIMSDSLLNGGVNFQIIYDAFVRRNILPTISLDELSELRSEIQVYNTMAFTKGAPLMIRSNDHQLTSYRLTSLNGSMVRQGHLDHSPNEVTELDLAGLDTGIYIITLSTSTGVEVSYKISRLN